MRQPNDTHTRPTLSEIARRGGRGDAKRLTKDNSSSDKREIGGQKRWKGREGATRQLEGGKLGTGSSGRRRGKVSAAGPPSPSLISSISSNHCDRRRAREGESEQGRERRANGRSQEGRRAQAEEGDRENE